MKYEEGWKVVGGTEKDFCGAILVQGLVEISNRNMVMFIHGGIQERVPNNSIHRKKKDALVEFGRYLDYAQEFCRQQTNEEFLKS